MPDAAIRVGVVGVNAERGWASTAHIPALRSMPGFELVAISTCSAETARRAGDILDVRLAFSDYRELVVHPEVDLVAVTVKAPAHKELVVAALSESKAVYCEWPLGVDSSAAVEMAQLARTMQTRTVVGLQGRQAPEVQYVRELVGEGYVGEVLSTSMIGSSVPGGQVERANAYMVDERSGANLLSVAFAHGVDTLAFVLGEVTEMHALTDTRRSRITIRETGERLRKTAPDQVLMAARLATGATASVHYREGLAGGTGLFWEINGTEGTITVTADGGLPGIFPMTIRGAREGHDMEQLDVPRGLVDRWPALSPLAGTPAFNVARTYAAFLDDWRSGGRTAPNFEAAADRHLFLDAVMASSLQARMKPKSSG